MNGVRAQLPRWWRWLAGAVLLLAILAYGFALAGEYVFDDIHSIARNPAVHDLGNALRFFGDPSLFSGESARMYRPVLLLSFAVNLAGGGEAMALKLGNVLLHAAVALLAARWCWLLSRRLRAAAIVGAMFAVHPLASEAVNLVSARSELLLVLGLLLGLHGHLAWLRRGPGVRSLAGVALGAVVACGSKETGVMLPLLCLAQAACLRQGWPDRLQWRRALLGITPAVGVVVAYLVARHVLLGQVAVQLLGRTGGDPGSGSGRTLLEQLATMGTLLPSVLWQCVWPARLSLDPAVTFRTSFAEPAVWAGWACMLLLTGLALWRGPGARLRRLGVGFAWAVALPWIVIPLNAPLAEHRLYGPLLGLLLCLVPALRRLRALRVSPRSRVACRAAFALLLGLGITQAAARSWLYRDETLLWRAELAGNPRSFRAHWGIGTALLRRGDRVGALAPLAQAHALYPRHPEVLMHYVETLLQLPFDAAQPELALVAADELAALAPFDPWFRSLQAQAHLQAGRRFGKPELFERAERLALSCLEVGPPKGFVYQLAAQARQARGDRDGALAHLDAAIARGLAPVGVRLDRAALLREMGRAAEAQRELQCAQMQAPFDPLVLQALQQLASPAK